MWVNCLIFKICILQYKNNVMPQVINTNNKKSEIPSTEKINAKVKTRFQEEWAKSIPADKAMDDLLIYVKGLWKK
jgi:hypothetical protein